MRITADCEFNGSELWEIISLRLPAHIRSNEVTG
jgi:hypothetical protein